MSWLFALSPQGGFYLLWLKPWAHDKFPLKAFLTQELLSHTLWPVLCLQTDASEKNMQHKLGL